MQCTLESNLRLLKCTTAIEKKHKSLWISREAVTYMSLEKLVFFCTVFLLLNPFTFFLS